MIVVDTVLPPKMYHILHVKGLHYFTLGHRAFTKNLASVEALCQAVAVGVPWMRRASAVGTAVIVTLEEESSTAAEKQSHQNTARLHS